MTTADAYGPSMAQQNIINTRVGAKLPPSLGILEQVIETQQNTVTEFVVDVGRRFTSRRGLSAIDNGLSGDAFYRLAVVMDIF